MKTWTVATDDKRWVVLLVYLLLCIDAHSCWRLAARAELWKSKDSKASIGKRSVEQGEGEHKLEVWSTQVRFVLLQLLFEIIFVLDRKGGILQWE